jgi:5-methyltetrahydrofolate--homocysteine methyltransferase
LSLREIYKYINQVALFRGQWQYQKGEQTAIEYQKMLTETVEPVFRKLQDDAITEKLLQPEVVYGYFPCKADGNKLNVWKNIGKSGPEGEPVQFNFPRQTDGRGLCISDFFKDTSSKEYDTVAFHIVTVGKKVSEVAGNLFKQNQYKDYLHLHGFGVETAEALAEFWHKRIREELGIANNDAQAIRDLFAQGYQGSRYSFGYPACPDLEQQVLIANLLDSERIGVSLTETFQWEPEQTTSAIIVHHPDARYFTVKQ